MSAAQPRFALAAFEPDRHIADFLAAKAALEKKRRLVRAILVKDLSVESIAGLEEFFSLTAQNISSGARQKTHGKYKAVRKKIDAPPQIKPGVPCLIILAFIAIVVVAIMIG